MVRSRHNQAAHPRAWPFFFTQREEKRHFIVLSMKLFAPILLGLTEAGDHRQTVEMARDTFGNSSRVCGMMSGEYGHMAETMMLE